MTPTPGSAARLAALAGELQARLEQLHGDVDPSWHAPLGLAGGSGTSQAAQAAQAWQACQGSGAARRRLAAGLLALCCGSHPPLATLGTAAGRLALLERRALLARLAALALLGRPGVLRCCVQRPVRAALQDLLGPAFNTLRQRSGGAAVPADVAAWAPLAWAWIGYRELLAERAWPHPGVRRLARLGLPATRSGAPALARVPPATAPAAQRLAELDQLFEPSPPC